jgi:hypothetical protein
MVTAPYQLVKDRGIRFSGFFDSLARLLEWGAHPKPCKKATQNDGAPQIAELRCSAYTRAFKEILSRSMRSCSAHVHHKPSVPTRVGAYREAFELTGVSLLDRGT